jgi:hypothetical protein
MVIKFSISQVADAKKVADQLLLSMKVIESRPFFSKKILIAFANLKLRLTRHFQSPYFPSKQIKGNQSDGVRKFGASIT